jgi:2-haloacid dehalogenase
MIVFDAYGTLWDVTAIEAQCEALVGAQNASALLTLWRQKQLEYAFLRTIMNRYQPFWVVTQEALAYALDALGLSLAAHDRHTLLSAWLAPVPYADAIETLRSLAHHQRIILSNADPMMLTQGLTASRLDQVIDDAISVHDAQRYKPHPSAYQLVVDRYPRPLEDVYFVSSNGWDVAGASHYGFQSIWVNRQNRSQEHLGSRPVAVIASLHELAAVLPAPED